MVLNMKGAFQFHGKKWLCFLSLSLSLVLFIYKVKYSKGQESDLNHCSFDNELNTLLSAREKTPQCLHGQSLSRQWWRYPGSSPHVIQLSMLCFPVLCLVGGC